MVSKNKVIGVIIRLPSNDNGLFVLSRVHALQPFIDSTQAKYSQFQAAESQCPRSPET